MAFLHNLSAFFIYFVSAMGLMAVFMAIYLHITPHAEIAQIRRGNMAATVALLGAVLGFALPLASCIAHSVSVVDMVIWALIALVVQVLVYFLSSRLVPQLTDGIDQGNVAHGAFLGGVALTVGVVNAACMVY